MTISKVRLTISGLLVGSLPLCLVTPRALAGSIGDVRTTATVVRKAVLPGGMVLEELAGGAHALVPVGTTIRVGLTRDKSGGVDYGLTAAPPEPITASGLQTAAARYRVAGWSPDRQLQVLRQLATTPFDDVVRALTASQSSTTSADETPPAGDIFSSGCMIGTSDYGYEEGCWVRRYGQMNANDRYLGDMSYSDGRPGSLMQMNNVKIQEHYVNGTILSPDPINTVSTGSCATFNYGVTGYGLSFSESRELCPEKIDPILVQPVYSTQWSAPGGTTGTRSSEEANAFHVPSNSQPSGFTVAFHVIFKPRCFDAMCQAQQSLCNLFNANPATTGKLPDGPATPASPNAVGPIDPARIAC